MNRQRQLQIVVVGVIALLVFTLYPRSQANTGVSLGGDIILIDGDGNQKSFSTPAPDDIFASINKFFGVGDLNVIQIGNTKLTDEHTILIKAYADWMVDAASGSSNVQYWMAYSTELSGRMFDGTRAVIGGATYDVQFQSFTGRESTSRWNSMDLWGSAGFIKNYYKEIGSGGQVGNINFGADTSKSFTDAFKGIPLADKFASQLAGFLAVESVKDKQHMYIGGFEEPAYQVYIDMQRINWQGVSLNIGDFTAGVGRWAEFYEGDKYQLDLYINYIFRFQDITGEWSDWQNGRIRFGSINFEIVEGTWSNVALEIGGGWSWWG